MKLIYTLILLLFSSSVFADFVEIEGISISDLLDKNFNIKQIHTFNAEEFVYHLYKSSLKWESIAICYIWETETYCKIDTNDKDLIEDLKNNKEAETLSEEM